MIYWNIHTHNTHIYVYICIVCTLLNPHLCTHGVSMTACSEHFPWHFSQLCSSVVTRSCIALSGPSCPLGLSCDHACRATPTGGVCYCAQGYQLNPADNRTCEGKSFRPHLLGVCYCAQGYQLNPADNRTCEGKSFRPHLLGVCYCAQGYQLNPADNRTCEGKSFRPHLLAVCYCPHGYQQNVSSTTEGKSNRPHPPGGGGGGCYCTRLTVQLCWQQDLWRYVS